METDGIEHEDMKGQIKKEYIRRDKDILKSKLIGGNVISAINSRTLSIVRYGAGIMHWTKMELEELDWKIKNMMTMYGAQYPKVNVDRMYLQRCVREKVLIGLEDFVQVEVHSFETYLSTSKEKILKEVSRSRIIEINKYGRSKEEIHEKHQ